MTTYEQLEDEACKDGIEVIHYNFNSERIKGLYCDGVIGLNNSIRTTAERTCVLAEELGHHHTSVGVITDLSDAQNRKQERQARIFSYNRLIGLYGLINAWEHGCTNQHEIADYLGITEEFLCDAIYYYCDRYGTETILGNYIIYFIPNLVIGKRF